MNEFLDILPLIFYFIAGAIAILYQTLFGLYNFKITKQKNILFMCLVLFFGFLSIASAIKFWLLY